MLDPNEIVLLLLGLVALFFLVINVRTLEQIRHWRILAAAYLALLASWVLTILETFVWPTLLNHLEHLCDMVGAVLLLVWCFRFFLRETPPA